MRISKKHEFKTRYIVKPKYEQSRWIIAIFFCILLFIFVFFPIFGLNWRYQIGGAFSVIIDGIGTLALTIGGFLTLLGFVGIFTRSSHWPRNVIIGIALLWIGCWCTGSVIDFFGILIGDSTSSGGGYH
ncbi:MAG: hypothetical protein ACFFE5_16395 [Candidatus Thorarchaeota archaeon]